MNALKRLAFKLALVILCLFVTALLEIPVLLLLPRHDVATATIFIVQFVLAPIQTFPLVLAWRILWDDDI